MKSGGLLKNVAVLGGAKGISQGLTLAISPILTRIFSPEDLGVFALFAVFIGLLGGFASMRYEYALPLASDETEAANIVALCGVILCVFLFIFCVVLLAVHEDLAAWLGAPALRPYVWLLPVGLLGIGIGQIAQLWVVRIKDFRRLAAAGVAASVVSAVMQIGLGVLRFGPAGLIFGRIGGIVCNSAIVCYPLLRDVRTLRYKLSVRGVFEVAKKHRQFPYFFTISSGINSLGREMPILVFTYFFGPAVTGLYALTQRVLNVPMILVGEQVRKVYYPYAAESARTDDLQKLTKTVFHNLVQVSLPGIFIIALIAPELFALVFGERWKEAGTYAQWLCPWLFVIFISTPLTRLPLVLERQRSELVFQAILLVLRSAALVVGGAALDVMLAVGLFAVASVLCWIGFMIWCMNLVKIRAREVFGILSIELAIAAAIVAPLIVAKAVFLGPDDGLWVLAVSVACLFVAVAVLIARNRHVISLVLGSKAP